MVRFSVPATPRLPGAFPLRRLTAALVAATLLPAAALAEERAWPGVGTVRLDLPSGWELASKDAGERGFHLRGRPRSGAAVEAQLSLLVTAPGEPVRAADLKDRLEQVARPLLDGSVEKRFEPKPLQVRRGSGWVVQFTDASLVGKPPEPGNQKMMRNALIALDDHLLLVATIRFDDLASPELAEAMALLSSLQVERSARTVAPKPAAAGAFEFTVPGSRVVVKVPDLGLAPDADSSPDPGYFKRSRRDPQLILSGWLEPAERYQGLEAFWDSERKSPAYQGAGAPQHVELLRIGPWEVVAFDVPVPGGASAHLRAQRVQAGSWVDLHLSTTQARPAEALRAELVAALRAIDVVEKQDVAGSPAK